MVFVELGVIICCCYRGKVYLVTPNTGARAMLTITVGESFLEKSLFKPFAVPYVAKAGNIMSEVLFLSRNKFRYICRVHMDPAEYAALVAEFDPPVESTKSTGPPGLARGMSRKQGTLQKGE